MLKRIQLRRDTTENWENINPVLASGELGVNLDTKQIKLGDGTSPWNDLEYYSGVDIDLSNYVTEEYLNDALASINIPDVSNFITANDIPAIPSDISELTDNQNLLGADSTGDLTFTGSTISGVDNTDIVIESVDADEFVTAKITLQPEYSTINLSTISGDNSNTFTLDNNDFATGIWENNGYGNGRVTFTGAQNILDFFQNTLTKLSPENVTITLNSEPPFEWSGSTGIGDGTIEFSTGSTFPETPLAITSVEFRYRAVSSISVGYDNQEIQLNAQQAGVRIDASSSIYVYGGSSVEINSDSFFSINSGEDINLSTSSNYIIGLSAGDINLNASDDILIESSDRFRLRNNSATEDISIITNGDNVEKSWNFKPDGTITFPDATIQSTAFTNTISNAGSSVSINSNGDFEFKVGEKVAFAIRNDGEEIVDQQIHLGSNDTAYSTLAHSEGVGLELDTLNNDTISFSIVKDGVGEDPPTVIFLKFNSNGTLTLEDVINATTTRFINLDELKTVVAASTDFADFQTRMANLT